MKAIAAWEGGIHGRIQVAVSACGKKFQRFQGRSPYGYKWTPWMASGNVDIDELPRAIEAGFATLYRVHHDGWKKWRLPNV